MARVAPEYLHTEWNDAVDAWLEARQTSCHEGSVVVAEALSSSAVDRMRNALTHAIEANH